MNQRTIAATLGWFLFTLILFGGMIYDMTGNLAHSILATLGLDGLSTLLAYGLEA